jgi:putative spermidine/putrescine transport system ATP-binding protein
VEQVGTPRQIYEYPSSAFVAGFVGTSNMLNAEQSGALLGVFAPHSVRPERIRIVPAGQSADADELIVAGSVSDVQYLGAECRVRVRLADSSSMIASVPSDGLAGIAIGGAVHLAWPRSAALLVAHDDVAANAATEQVAIHTAQGEET